MASRMTRAAGVCAAVWGASFAAIGVAAVLAGCDEPPKDKGAPKQPGSNTPDEAREKVTVGGKTFTLELALDDQTRFRGLSGRTHIDADGGMLFVFPSARNSYFVMRDCPIPIDIIFLDPTGRVTAAHKMEPEEPRGADEKELSAPYPGAPEWTWVNEKYEDRLKHYPSRYDAQFVIELAGGTLDSLKLREGDQVKLDVAALKKRAR